MIPKGLIIYVPATVLLSLLVYRVFRHDSINFTNKRLNSISNYLALVITPFPVVSGISVFVVNFFRFFSYSLKTSVSEQLSLVLIITATIVPLIYIFYIRILHWIGRIFMGVFFVFNTIVFSITDTIYLTLHSENTLTGLDTFWKSYVFGAVILAIFIVYVLKSWNITNIQAFSNTWVRYPQWLISLIAYIWYLDRFFIASPSNWFFPLYWNFSVFKSAFKLEYLFSAVEAGLAEELFWRLLILSVLIQILKKQKYGILIAVLIQAALFSIWHLLNFTSTANTSYVFAQALYALFFGITAGILVIWTKNIFVVVVLHLLNDLFSFWSSSGTSSNKISVGSQLFVSAMFEMMFVVFIVAIYLKFNHGGNLKYPRRYTKRSRHNVDYLQL